MLAENRAAYRVSLSGDDALSVEVTGKTGQVAGEVADLSLKGAAVLLPLAQDPSFAIGELVTVQFHSAKVGLVEVKATVQARSELDAIRRFGLKFSDPDALRAKLSLKLLRLFNQRKLFRVEPSKAAPVEVRIGVEELEFVGRLQDISADGVSVLMDAGVEARLASVVDVSLRLRPPPDDKTLAFRASIRNRTRVEGENSTSYGLRLDPTGTPDFPEQQQHIVSYVMMRQRDLLQSRIGL